MNVYTLELARKLQRLLEETQQTKRLCQGHMTMQEEQHAYTIAQLTSELQQYRQTVAMQIIITNLCHVLGALNTNCPFRRPLIGELSIGLLNNEVQHIHCGQSFIAQRLHEIEMPCK